MQRLTPGLNEVPTDYWISGMWLKTGTSTFVAVSRLRNGECLYAVMLTQRLVRQAVRRLHVN
jgi:hypothetical protein